MTMPYCPKVSFPTVGKRQLVASSFFKAFVKPVSPWLRELVARYKEMGEFAEFPTYIADFYTGRRDREIALLSTLCMDWGGDVYSQVYAMRTILGGSPWEWFYNRLFVSLSVGSEQDNVLDGGGAEYWKIARLFDCIHDVCVKSRTFELEQCFSKGKGRMQESTFERFAEQVCKRIEYQDGWMFKANVIELVLRSSDGIGLGLWKSCKGGEKCPRNGELVDFLRIWINDFSSVWDFDDSVDCFGFEKRSDFFYFWMAWTRLSRLRPKECSRFSTVFWKRYDERNRMPPSGWKRYLPTIDFEK